MDAKAQSYSSNTNWLILVDTSRCITSIYTGSWNNWSLNRRYVCSTGKASTPTVIGEYQVYGKGYSFGHGYTCYYYTQFYGDYLFHSSPYYVNSNRVMDPTMGVPSSAGCVRLEIQNAKWIYDNIPYGTKVVTYWYWTSVFKGGRKTLILKGLFSNWGALIWQAVSWEGSHKLYALPVRRILILYELPFQIILKSQPSRSL